MTRPSSQLSGVGLLAAMASLTACSGIIISTQTAPVDQSASLEQPPPPPSLAQQTFERLTDAQRAGQLLMVGIASTGATPNDLAMLTTHHVGSVILTGNSNLSVAQTAQLTAAIQQTSPNLPLLVATDQEGGSVQRLQGPGFTAIPAAAQQGQTAPAALQSATAQWAAELHAASVNMNLGPVLDTVPPDAISNPPIGDLGREYGRSPASVSQHGMAVIRGMMDANVLPTIKHFPGLGRVAANPDFATHVTDTVTTRQDEYLAPFKAGIDAGTPCVMMSTAVYTQIDPANPAAFSYAVVTELLRNQLGFQGVVVSDDLGIAAQVKDVPPADRALRFIAAGGDLALTVDAAHVPAIVAAVLGRMAGDPKFKAQVDAAVLRVLAAKQTLGLL